MQNIKPTESVTTLSMFDMYEQQIIAEAQHNISVDEKLDAEAKELLIDITKKVADKTTEYFKNNSDTSNFEKKISSLVNEDLDLAEKIKNKREYADIIQKFTKGIIVEQKKKTTKTIPSLFHK